MCQRDIPFIRSMSGLDIQILIHMTGEKIIQTFRRGISSSYSVDEDKGLLFLTELPGAVYMAAIEFN